MVMNEAAAAASHAAYRKVITSDYSKRLIKLY